MEYVATGVPQHPVERPMTAVKGSFRGVHDTVLGVTREGGNNEWPRVKTSPQLSGTEESDKGRGSPITTHDSVTPLG